MSSDYYRLTKKDDKALCRVIDQHVEREESRLSYRWLMWKLAFNYLQGARRFDVFDPHSAKLSSHYVDPEGKMEFQSQELMGAIDRVVGQLSAMDVRPMVHRQGNSLSSIRDRARAQVMADAVVSGDQINRTHTDFSFMLVALGCAGITGHVEDHPLSGLTADYEVIHPRELYPFPSLGQDHTKVRGLVRRRTVPLAWLKDRFGARVSRNLDHLYWWEAEAGAVPHHDTAGGDDHGGGIFSYSSGGRGWTGPADDRESTYGLVRVEELWLTGHRNTVRRYIVKSGEYVLFDTKDAYEDLEFPMPIGVARFIENGTFHGMGMFDLLFPIHRQMELLLKSLFNNIRDIDRYGITVLPQGQYNSRSALQEIGESMRVLMWEPDPIEPGFRPFNIQPHNLGDVPGKTAAFAKQLMDGLSPWQNLLAEKGRVDSAAGLGFLDEKLRQLMTNSTRAVDMAWSQAHRAVLAAVSREAKSSRRALPVNNLTIDLAGAVIDPEKDEVSFGDTPVPRLSHLSVTIREANPKSAIVRKQEALQLFQMEGLNDPMRFMLLVLKEGLDFAFYMDEEKSAYESVVRNILLLYGDGEEPGQFWAAPHTAMPDLQLRVLNGFMASTVMAVAAPRVVDEFNKYKQFLLESSGMVLPAAVPNPDDFAMLMMEEEKMARMGPPAALQGQGAPTPGAELGAA